MAWVVLSLGIALCGAGAAALWSGVAYMPVEWGWSQIIAGATAISGGVVTMALAAVVHRLRALQGVLLAYDAPQAVPGEPAPAADARAQSELAVEPAKAAVPFEQFEPTPGLAEESSTDAVPASLASAGATDEANAGFNGSGRRVGIGDVLGLQMPANDAAPAAASTAPLPPGFDERPQDLATGVDAAAALPSDEVDGAERTVVGRYDAGDASYALFSDGTIDVETETGIHRFASMEELKAFLERQDSVAQAAWPE